MCAHEPQALTRTVLQALRQSGHRAVLARGWGGLQEAACATGPDGDTQGNNDIFWLDEAPHAWLLPRMLLAVHHGGAGTTAAVARAGIPSVVLPFLGDQPFWAWRLHTLGVAPPALKHQRLRVAALVQALGEATSETMRQRAADLGARLRQERGAEEAVVALRSWGLLAAATHRPARVPAHRPLPCGVAVAMDSGTADGT
jgi:UDP:flavonoid glycosyltransferase YjiC (YdhE family)